MNLAIKDFEKPLYLLAWTGSAVAGAAAVISTGLKSDILLGFLVLAAWGAGRWLLERGVKHFGWASGFGRLLAHAMDSYCFVASMGLNSAAPSLTARAFGVFCFASGLLGNPPLSASAIAVGFLSYLSVFTLKYDPGRVGAVWVFLIGFAGAACGLAWRMTLPLLLKAFNNLLASGNQPADLPQPASGSSPHGEADGGDDKQSNLAVEAEVAFRTASFSKQIKDLQDKLNVKEQELEAARAASNAATQPEQQADAPENGAPGAPAVEPNPAVEKA